MRVHFRVGEEHCSRRVVEQVPLHSIIVDERLPETMQAQRRQRQLVARGDVLVILRGLFRHRLLPVAMHAASQ